MEELKKPFVVARMVPNLDAPEIKQAVAQNYLQSMGMLFEATAGSANQIEAPKTVETIEAYDDETQSGAPWEEPPEEPDTWSGQPGYGPEDYDDRTPPQRPAIGAPAPIICSRCHQEITGGTSRKGRSWTPNDVAAYSQRTFGRVLCTSCQEIEKRGTR